MLEVGMTHTFTTAVLPQQTARVMKSGALDVLATPILIAWMEGCCLDCVQPRLESGKTTVGTAVNVTHEAPTPVGMSVRLTCVLREIDGRKLTFAVEAADEAGIIGRGTHQRFIVDSARFQEKCDAKKKNG